MTTAAVISETKSCSFPSTSLYHPHTVPGLKALLIAGLYKHTHAAHTGPGNRVDQPPWPPPKHIPWLTPLEPSPLANHTLCIPIPVVPLPLCVTSAYRDPIKTCKTSKPAMILISEKHCTHNMGAHKQTQLLSQHNNNNIASLTWPHKLVT